MDLPCFGWPESKVSQGESKPSINQSSGASSNSLIRVNLIIWNSPDPGTKFVWCCDKALICWWKANELESVQVPSLCSSKVFKANRANLLFVLEQFLRLWVPVRGTESLTHLALGYSSRHPSQMSYICTWYLCEREGLQRLDPFGRANFCLRLSALRLP